jgi:hypothetical protein
VRFLLTIRSPDPDEWLVGRVSVAQH